MTLVVSLARAAADNFVASLEDTTMTERERLIVWNAYVSGWIQGCYAGQNEARHVTCRTPRLSRWHVTLGNTLGKGRE